MSELLEHEIIELRRILDIGLRENKEAAADMAEAVDDPNVYHDNAAYDEVIERMKLIDGRYGPLVKLMGEVALVEYPEEQCDTVCLGSLVSVDFGNSVANILIAGLVSNTDIYRKALEEDGIEADVASLQSPIGFALTGAKVGDEVVYSVRDRDINLTVLGINQSWIKKLKKGD